MPADLAYIAAYGSVNPPSLIAAKYASCCLADNVPTELAIAMDCEMSKPLERPLTKAVCCWGVNALISVATLAAAVVLPVLEYVSKNDCSAGVDELANCGATVKASFGVNPRLLAKSQQF